MQREYETKKDINKVEKEIEEKYKESIENKVGSKFSAPKKLCRIANIPKEKVMTIRFRQRGDKDTKGNIVNRGASRHILDDHVTDISDEFLNKMRETITNPDDVVTTKGDFALKKFLYTK